MSRPDSRRPIVFLHIPKTAGQTIHHALVRLAGKTRVSPIRTHTQAQGQPQMPPGYSLYSGHIDWTELDSLPPERFVFSVLRDPRERIASFYFFLKGQAQKASDTASEPLRIGARQALELSADDYFMQPDPQWQGFVRDHFDNFYCSYFATRMIRGRGRLRGLPPAEILARARTGLEVLDAVYSTEALEPLEDEIRRRYGRPVVLAGRYRNAGSLPQEERRWPRLMALLERDATRQRLDSFAAMDEELMAGLTLPTATDRPPGGLGRLMQMLTGVWR